MSPPTWKPPCTLAVHLPACAFMYPCLLASVQVVLLSPDAPEPLTCMEADKVYVIGGIVDRTVKKGTTLNFAVSCL